MPSRERADVGIELNVYERHEPPLEALGSIYLDHAFFVHHLRFLTTADGVKIEWPTQRLKDGSDVWVVRPAQGVSGDRLTERILELYRSRAGGGNPPGPSHQDPPDRSPLYRPGERLEVTDVRLKLVDAPMVKALVSLELCGTLEVRGIRLFQGRSGRMALAMPVRPNGMEIFWPAGPSPSRQLLTDAAAARYEAMIRDGVDSDSAH